jgi:hypothetical protein
MAAMGSPQQQQQQVNPPQETFSEAGTDDRTDQEKQADKELAERLSIIIEDANRRVLPIVKMIRSASLSRLLVYEK